MSKSYSVNIVGAGLAGLATAISLARDGHHVTVLESRPEVSEIGAGIQIPPNASRILCSWGLKEKLASKSTTSKGVYFMRYANGEVLALFKQGLRNEKDDLPNWTIYRPDYQKILYDLAVELGVQIKLGVMVHDPNDLEGDLVVLADGIGSKMRAFVVGSQRFLPTISNNAYRVLINREDMLSDETTAGMMDGFQRLWLGPDRAVISYTIAEGKYFNMVLEHPGAAEPGNWNKPGDVEEMRREFSDFDPILGRLLAKTDRCVDWTLGRLPSLPKWSTDNGRLVLLGDAAHAMTPDYAQGAAMCVEDAAVLGVCLRRAQSVREATSGFEKLRKERAEKVQQASWDNSMSFVLHDGPKQEARDRAYKERMDEQSHGTTGKKVESALTRLSAWVVGTDVVEEGMHYWDAESGRRNGESKV